MHQSLAVCYGIRADRGDNALFMVPPAVAVLSGATAATQKSVRKRATMPDGAAHFILLGGETEIIKARQIGDMHITTHNTGPDVPVKRPPIRLQRHTFVAHDRL